MAQNIPISNEISEYLVENFGSEYYTKYLEYIHSEPNIYIRVSPIFNEPGELATQLKRYGIEIEEVPNFPNAYRVLSGGEFISKTIEYTTGRYYIQSLSSMVPPLILNPSCNDKVLDLCAAPGSKSSQIAELMNNKGTLYVNESNLDRIKGLIFNLDKLNLVNVGAIKHKGELLSKLFENYFDKILADVPCSGLGILQKKGEVSNWWNLSTAERIAELQFRLLVSAVKMLKAGGELVYSTCTLTIEENELVLNKFLKKYPVEIIPIELPVKSNSALTQNKSEPLTKSTSDYSMGN
ncbi:MAG: RsmB/NOP family class I SAM-dependent RNA methyltransferase [Melioribacteraceae bacterium]|nr:RsmB/NOP family class I SAM-dependent RNA methyltransferase [Melioribacteraceae bacterium]